MKVSDVSVAMSAILSFTRTVSIQFSAKFSSGLVDKNIFLSQLIFRSFACNLFVCNNCWANRDLRVTCPNLAVGGEFSYFVYLFCSCWTYQVSLRAPRMVKVEEGRYFCRHLDPCFWCYLTFDYDQIMKYECVFNL